MSYLKLIAEKIKGYGYFSTSKWLLLQVCQNKEKKIHFINSEADRASSFNKCHIAGLFSSVTLFSQKTSNFNKQNFIWQQTLVSHENLYL